MERRSRKGQIEFVAIAAFVVLILVAVFFILQPPQGQGDPWSNMLSDEQRLIRDSLKNFLKLATEEELTRLYEQGGFIDITGTVNIKFSGLEIPLWVSCGAINIPDIERELARGINEYIVRNLERETEFYGKETIIDAPKLRTEVILHNKKITVKFSLPATVRGFEMPDSYEVESDSNLKEILEFSKGFTYELNETRFLEMITIINMLHSNKSGSSWTPVKGTLTKCGERIVVRREQFLEGVKQMLRYTARHLVWNRNPPRIANNPFFVLNSVEDKSYDLDVSFFYPDEWDDEIPEKFITVPETLRETAKPILLLVPFCIEQYAVSYSFQYPMIVAVKDNIMNQHFRFAVYASIKDNLPDTECEATLFDGKTDYEEKCIDNANCDFNIIVTDSGGNHIEGADVTFYGCDLGVTNEAGVLASDTVKAPCMMSELVVRKEGFMSSGAFITPDELLYFEVPMKRIADPMKIKYYGVPMVGLNRDSEGNFENFVIIDQLQPINLVEEYFTSFTPPDLPPIFKLETSLWMKPTEPNLFTEEDADFVITNTDDENNLVHEKNETIIHPIQYEVSGTVNDISRGEGVVTGYINQIVDVGEGVNELCVYFPVVVGDLSPPYTNIKTLDKSVRDDQSEDLKLKLQHAGLDYLIGECGPVTLTACGDGSCQPTETCETDGNVKCPGMTETLPPDTCRITCNYCGDAVWDLGWEECDSMEEKYSSCNYGEPFNILAECGLGTSEDNQYVCNSTCEQDGGWCGDTIVQDGSQTVPAPQTPPDFGEQCDFGTDINCCESCHWTCSESDRDSYGPLKFGPAGTDNYVILFDDKRTVFELPACRILGSGTIDAELIQSDKKSAIVFVTDTSQSISGDLVNIKRAISNSIDALYAAADSGVDIHVGLVRFSTDVTSNPILDISDQNNAETLKNVVSSYSAAGLTYTKNAVTEAAYMLNSFQADNRIIILLSDGDPSDNQNPAGVAGTVKTTGTEIYAIAFTIQPLLRVAMCKWSSDNGENCYTDSYSYTGTDADTTYEKITNDLKGLPQGDVTIAIGTAESVFDASGILNDIPVDLSGLVCSDESQIIEFLSTEFKGRGSIKYSDFRIEYCDACNPDS